MAIALSLGSTSATTIFLSGRSVTRPSFNRAADNQRGHREGLLADRPEIEAGPGEDVDWDLGLSGAVKNIIPVRLPTILCENDQLRPGRPGTRQSVLRSKPDLAGFDRPPNLLV